MKLRSFQDASIEIKQISFVYQQNRFTVKNAGKNIGLKFIPSQSELFRFIPISVCEPMRIIPNQSKIRFVSRLMRNGQKSIRLNPINSETSIRINPNHSDLRFIWINSNWKFGLGQSRLGLIWIENLVSDWFGLMSRN